MNHRKDEQNMQEAFAAFRKRYSAVDAAMLQGEVKRLLKADFPELSENIKQLKVAKGNIKLYFSSPQAASDAMLIRSSVAESLSVLLGREISVEITF